MRTAVRDQERLLSPTVGVWRPVIGLGAPLSAGALLGHLRRAGLDVAVEAPAGVSGVATSVVVAGQWCAYGVPLVTMGEGGTALKVEQPAPSVVLPPGVQELRCDIDGTVFLRPEPGAPCFVSVGDTVEALRTVALVEVMKTFTPVRAPIAGTIEAVQVEDGASVEANAALFWIRSA